MLICLNSAHSARILGVFQFPSYSHQIVYQQIWRELALRGHDVTVITPNPINDKSIKTLKEIDVGYIKNLLPKEQVQESFSKDNSPIDILKAFFSMNLKFQEAILKDERFIEIYRNPKEKFDMILIECLHPGMYALSGHFKAPIIGISSMEATATAHASLGNTYHPVLYPEITFPRPSDLNLLERMYSTYVSWYLDIYHSQQVIPEADQVARKYLGNDLPYLSDLANNVSLLLLNTNHIINNVRPNVPQIIQMGQVHIRPPKPLPQDLQQILDAAQQVVYFSLGSNVKSVNIDKKLQKIILDAMVELPYTFLWKFESDHLLEKPKNVIIRKWLPQQDVLAHPNVRAFVTQGGLQSIEEAISRQVPMVGLPFIADQPGNVLKIVEAGIALGLDPVTVTKNELKQTIQTVATSKEMRLRIGEIKRQLEDQPQTGLERAVWWIEYAIRHKGAAHLKSPTAQIGWFKYMFLDLILLAIVAVFVCCKSIGICFNMLFYVPAKDKTN